MIFSKAFFDLQLRFAEKVAQVTHATLAEVLIDYTTFYLSFELGRSFDPAHPVWQEYLAGLAQADDRAEWTHNFYLLRRIDYIADFYGSFYYSYYPENQTIRFHFMNRDASPAGVLSKERMPIRLQELRSMFQDIRAKCPDASSVRGSSWLYNLDGYKRLFPSEYTKTMYREDDEFPFLALWGQFLDRNGGARWAAATPFLSYIEQQSTLEALKECFPFQVLVPECAISYFYEFYREDQHDIIPHEGMR